MGIIAASGNPDVLSVPSVKGCFSFPSWVPDWSVPDDGSSWPYVLESDALRIGDTRRRWLTIGKSTCTPEFSPCGNELGLRGKVLDTVLEVGEILSYETVSQLKVDNRQRVGNDTLVPFEQWEAIARAFRNKRYVNGEPIVDAYWKTLVGGDYSDNGDRDERELRS